MAVSYTTARTTAALAQVPAGSSKTTLATAMNTAGAAIATFFNAVSPGAGVPAYQLAEDSFVRMMEDIGRNMKDQTT